MLAPSMAAKRKKAVPKKSASPLADRLAWVKEAPKLPKAVDPKALPVLVGTLAPLDASITVDVLRALAGAKGDAPLAEALRTETTAESRDALAIALLAIWEEKEFHGRLGWILDAVASLAGDRAILALASSVAGWPAEGDTGRKRAISAAHALAHAGTDASILALMGLRQTVVVPSVLEAAIEALDRVVDARNTTLSELFDAVTPTLGLDANGTRTLEHDGRSFTVIFDDHFEPRLKDAGGDLADLGDDPVWTALASQLRESVKVQTFRLEQDMITGRRWSVEAWTRSLRDHPLLVSFTRRLVWGVYGEHGLTSAFRTAEDRTLLGPQGEVKLTDDARIGVVHPLHLDEAARAEWATHLGDYEIIQPFAQLGRPLFQPLEEEQKETKTARFATSRFKSGVLRDLLVRAGWQRDSDYLRKEYSRAFERVVAIATMDPGVYAGAATYDVFDQTIASIEFREKKGRGKSKEPMPLAEVPPVAFSEAVRDLADVLASQE
jgi:hypothetical protein